MKTAIVTLIEGMLIWSLVHWLDFGLPGAFFGCFCFGMGYFDGRLTEFFEK